MVAGAGGEVVDLGRQGHGAAGEELGGQWVRVMGDKVEGVGWVREEDGGGGEVGFFLFTMRFSLLCAVRWSVSRISDSVCRISS